MEDARDEESPVEETLSSDESMLTVSPDVIRSIAFREAAIIDGIVAVEDTSNVWSVVRGRTKPKGIAVEMKGEKVTLALSISVRYGFRIPQIILELRQRITDSVRHMTGYKVAAINVTVNRLYLKEIEIGEALQDITSDTGVSEDVVEFR
ncbi:MAG: Asp23/Gls24 family envelope stress response protein [Planctomycetota bacterium]|nr:Asp23/Gls24 family envelope stress response protein [Planctomycetota bacterium]MDA1141820.1 Asp23/Gls24 family envelope stress response protein [Planctomycetota bacterium]